MRQVRWLVSALWLIGMAASGVAPARAAVPSMAVLGWAPGTTMGAALNAPLTVYFNRPIDRQSVLRGWHMFPATTGRFSFGRSSVSFQPAAPLRSRTTYSLSIAGALSTSGNSAPTFGVRFMTGEALRAMHVAPANGTTEVPISGTIAVTFNHPMVPLGGVDSETSSPRGWSVLISPRLGGYGSWLGTSTWVFHPSSMLQPATRYAVLVRGTARDATGEKLGHSVRWSFRTATPELYSRSPRSQTQFVSPAADIRITFDQLMDHRSTEAALQVTHRGVAVPATFRWSGATLIVHPASPLRAGATYRVAISRAALSVNRQAHLRRGAVWDFTVAPAPRVNDYEPQKNGTAWANPPWNFFPRFCCQSYGPYQATIAFNTPMSKKSLDAHLHIDPSVDRFSTSLSQDSANDWLYSINGNFNPSSAYTITLAPGVVDAFGRPLGESVTYPFKTSELHPSVALYGQPNAPALAFSSGQVVRAPLQTLNVPKVHVQLIKTTLFDLGNGAPGCNNCAPSGTTVRSWTQSISGARNQIVNPRVQVATRDGKPLAPGVYWLGVSTSYNLPGWHGDVSSDGNWPPSSSTGVLVNNVSMTVKTGGNGTLVWVNGALTGKPMAHTLVHLVDYNGATIVSARTDSHGLAWFPGHTTSGPHPVSGAQVNDGTHFGVALLSWQSNTTSPSNFSWPWQQNGATSNGTYAYTDRAIYRPGQVVRFRAVLWRDRDAVYSSLGERTVNVVATDSRGKQLMNRRVTLDRFGAVSGSFHVPSGAPMGDGSIYVGLRNGPSAFTSFTVADYRKPEFLTHVTAVAPRYAQGQTAQVKVSVKYVFGAPVTHQQVHWTAYSTATVQSPPGWDGYSFVDWEQYWQNWWQLDDVSRYGTNGALGQQIATGTGRTDANGNLTVDTPVDLARYPYERNVIVEVTATDQNAQSVSGRASLQEFHSDLAIGLNADQQVVNVGSPAAIAVAAVHQSGVAAPGTHLTATIARRTYTSKLISVQNSSQWQPVPHDTVVSTQALTTDASGKATLTFTPDDPGEYYITVSGTDASGNPTSTSMSIDAQSGASTDLTPTENTSIALKPDRSAYSVGQTAHILVPSPFAGATVLVTVERGTIRRYWTTHFSGTGGAVDVPVGIDALPNEYVTVTLYHGWRGSTPPEWRTGTAELHVRLDPRHVQVHLDGPTGARHPGDRVTYTVRTTVAGKPVSAEVSLALVDTAVLALKDQANPDILQALYSERPLGVTTGSEGAISIDNLTQRADFEVLGLQSNQQGAIMAPPAPKTGGGGGGGYYGPHAGLDLAASAAGRPASGITLRSHFADTALWRGAVVTNADGAASVTVTLPDNTTTWRMDARSISTSQSVGGATVTTLATRDLVLRPVLPRFFVQGDRVRVGVALNDRLDQAVTARVTLHASGLRLSAAPKTVTVPARGERLLLFPASVPESSVAVLTARAIPAGAGVEGDAVQISVPVHPPLTDETTATTGEVYSSTRQLVVVPRNAVSMPGALTVSVSSSITAGLGAAYRQLRPQRYESNDDVAQRVLAASSLHELPQPLTGLSAKAYRRLPLDTALGVQKLLDSEWYDGGWPWFTDMYTMQSDPLVTADVVEAIAASGRHGRLIDQALQRGQQFLVGHLYNSQVPADERAHLLAVLVASRAASGQIRTVAERMYRNSIVRLHLDAGSLADLGRALNGLGDRRSAAAIAAALHTDVQASATGAHWESAGAGFWGGPPVAATDAALRALLGASPHDPLEPAAARWLMMARRGDGWDCGRDTGQTIAGLAQYALAAREGQADYHYRVVTPVAAALQGWFTPTAHKFASHMSVPVSALHRTGATRVDFQRNLTPSSYGTGPLYYLARLHYYLPANDIAPRDEGVSVSRRFLDLAGHPVSSVADGSAVKVELTVHTNQTLLYVTIRDPLCSGCEPIDETLNTSQQGIAVQPSWDPWQRLTGPQDLTWYLMHSDLEDDHVSLYAYDLPPGTYRYTYLVQATVAGRYAVAPTHVSEQFFPEVFGRSAGQVLTVK